LHSIIRNQDLDQQVEWAADYVIGRFNKFLQDNSANGLCIVDNLPVKHQFQYLSNKFAKGLQLPSENRIVRLDRIRIFASSCSNASNISSAMDIVLGSFRYCINNPKNPEAARTMIGKVVDLMWGEKRDDNYLVIGKGLIIRPEIKQIKNLQMKKGYENLIEQINSLLSNSCNDQKST